MNWINPLIIFFGVPLVAIVTKRFHVYTMMIVGSLISAAPTFLLCLGPDLKVLITYTRHGRFLRFVRATPRAAHRWQNDCQHTAQSTMTAGGRRP